MGRSSKQLDERVALDLVGRIYAAAVDPSEWPSFLTAFANAVDGEATATWLHDSADASANLALPESSITAVAQWAPGFLETYAAHSTFTNVWTKNADRYAPGSAVTSDELFPDREFPKTECFADWGVIRALSGLAAPLWILNLEGRIAFATEAARALDPLHDGLWIGPDGTPTADHPADHDRLRRVIKAALDAGAAKDIACPPATTVRRRSTPDPLKVTAYPLSAPERLAGAGAALVVSDLSALPKDATAKLRDHYGLTSAEAKLALAVARGKSITDYAAEAQLSVNTVKTHMKRVLSKTGARNQAALIRLMLNL